MRYLAFAIGLTAFTSTTAWAQELPKSLNEPPSGPGSELKNTLAPVPGRVVPGWEVAGQIGGGEGFGLGARGGYTIDRGIYVGGGFTHFWGTSTATINGDQRTSRNQFGGEVGYKMFFMDRALEVRPFVFAGADFFHQFHDDTRSMSSETGFAFQANLLAAYHFGPAFVSAEFRTMITPTPVHVAGFGGVGMAL